MPHDPDREARRAWVASLPARVYGVLAPRFQSPNAEADQSENSRITPTPMCRKAHRMGLRGHSLGFTQGVSSTSIGSHVSPTVPDSQGLTLGSDLP
ncbi:MAG: hypothetical protein ACE5R6_08405 [Candidatus Heimdallarchaeota archaeon]